MLKILFFDIECTNLKANMGTITHFGYRWLHERVTKVLSINDYPDWKHDFENVDDSKICKDIKDILESADVVVGWYSKGFDLKYIQHRCVVNGLGPVPIVTHIDLCMVSRSSLMMTSNRLGNVAKEFGEEQKGGASWKVWIQQNRGVESALNVIRDYCKQDVSVTEDLYHKLRPLIKNFPEEKQETPCCSACGSSALQKRGLYYKGHLHYQRYQCTSCKKWSTSKTAVKYDKVSQT